VQDAAIALDARPIAGWKVGRIEPPIGSTNRLAGPIFASQIELAGATPAAMPIFADGFAAAEAEFLLRTAVAPDPAQRSYTIEAARALIADVHIGIEIASSPFQGINDHGAAVTISDFGNNNGLVIGPALPDWHSLDLDSLDVALLVNGETVGRATTATMLDGPFGAARFLFELLAERGIALPAGSWISSGAVTGVHSVTTGDRVSARFGEGLSVDCTIKAQE
jgi:2-keto-4-pentenoate hydratase